MNFGNVFISSLSLLFLCILVFWLYRSFRADCFRDSMFELRDELFDDAVQERIGFDSAAYNLLRSTMNGSIRFAHCLSLTRFIVLSKTSRPVGLPTDELFSERFRKAMDELDEDQKQLVWDYLCRMNFLLIEHMTLSSPLLLALVLPFAISRAIKKRFLKSLMVKYETNLNRLDTALLTS